MNTSIEKTEQTQLNILLGIRQNSKYWTERLLFLGLLFLSSYIVYNNIIYLTHDWPNKPYFQMRPHYTVAPFSILLMSISLYFALFFLRNYQSKLIPCLQKHSPFFKLFVPSAVWSLLIVTLMAPGWFNEDVIYTWHMACSGDWSNWYSPVHPFLYTLLLQIIPSMFFITCCNAVLASFALALVFNIAARLGVNRLILGIIFLLLLLSPPFLAMILMPIRDSVFASLFVIAVTFSTQLINPSYRAKTNIGLFFLWGLLSVYRMDALPVALIAIAILVGFSIKYGNYKNSTKAIIAFIVAFTFFNGLTHIVGYDNRDRAQKEYKLTLIAHPLTYLVREGFYTDTPEETQQKIEKVFTYEDLKKYWHPYNIAVFYSDGFNQKSSMEERNEAVAAANKLFVDNLGLYLASKASLFMKASGLQPNEQLVYYKKEALPEKRIDVPKFAGYFTKIDAWITQKINQSQDFHGFSLSGRMLYWNLILPNICLVLALLCWPVARYSALFALLMLAREAIVFLFAPASFVHYYFPVFLGGAIVFCLLIAEVYHFKSQTRGMQ
jgi:hypothetical protein